MNCSVAECGLIAKKRGMCGKHYRRIQRNGTLELTRQPAGSLVTMSGGYITQRINGVKKLQHVLVAEKALGKPLPEGVEIHHFNEIASDNRPGNLVVCPNRQYHMILHARQRALSACGNPAWRKCSVCKKYDDINNMTGRATRGQEINTHYHKPCAAFRARLKRQP
jgi:hypothetical protein